MEIKLEIKDLISLIKNFIKMDANTVQRGAKFTILSVEKIFEALRVEQNSEAYNFMVVAANKFEPPSKMKKVSRVVKSQKVLKDHIEVKTELSDKSLATLICLIFNSSNEYEVIENRLTQLFKNIRRIEERPNTLSKINEIIDDNIKQKKQDSTEAQDYPIDWSIRVGRNWKMVDSHQKQIISFFPNVNPIKTKTVWYVLSTLIVVILFIGIGYIVYIKNQTQDLIEQQIGQADKYFSTEQYDKALEEYKKILKSFGKAEHKNFHNDLTSKIGKTLWYTSYNDINASKKLKEAILFFEEVVNHLDPGSEEYHYNNLELIGAHFELYEILPKKEVLKKARNLLDEINPDNSILQGLKHFYNGSYYYAQSNLLGGNIDDLSLALKYFDESLQVFSLERSPFIYHDILNRKANVLMEKFHISNETKHLQEAKNNYQLIYANTPDQITKAISQFGIGHTLLHEYRIDSISGKLIDAEIQLKNTLEIYTKETTPNYLGSSYSMLSQIMRELYLSTKKTDYIERGINYLNESLLLYSSEHHTQKYYENKYKLAEMMYFLNSKNPSKERSIQVINFLNEPLNFYTEDYRVDIYSQIIAMQSDSYMNLSEIENSNYFKKKAYELVLHPKPSVLINRSDEYYYNIGKKYFEINHALYKYTKDESAYQRAKIYEMLYSDDLYLHKGGKELLKIIEVLRDGLEYELNQVF